MMSLLIAVDANTERMQLLHVLSLLACFQTGRVASFGIVSLNNPVSGTRILNRNIQHDRMRQHTRLEATKSKEDSSIVIFGHQGSRSPLVNWACLELQIPFEMGDLGENPHPFQQLPCLQDAEHDVVVFESGAILQYLQQTYADASIGNAASILSWIVWANASLDPVCFLETPQGKVYDTGLREPNRKVDQLNTILQDSSWLVDDDFSLADVAVASYGLYVLMFFPDVSIAKHWPHFADYLLRAVQRPTYAQAFGDAVQAQLVAALQRDLKQYA